MEHAVLPDSVEGWLAGHGLSLPVRNLSQDACKLQSFAVRLGDDPVHMAHQDLCVSLRPGQAYLLPIPFKQRRATDAEKVHIRVVYCTDAQPQEHMALGLSVPLIRRHSRSEPYNFTYRDQDGTFQMAVAVAPEDGSVRAYPILALHGAGVDLRAGDEFSTSLSPQRHSWVRHFQTREEFPLVNTPPLTCIDYMAYWSPILGV